MGMVYFKKGKLKHNEVSLHVHYTGKKKYMHSVHEKKVTYLNLINHPTLKMSCDICPAKQHWQKPPERLSDYRAFFLK